MILYTKLCAQNSFSYASNWRSFLPIYVRTDYTYTRMVANMDTNLCQINREETNSEADVD